MAFECSDEKQRTTSLPLKLKPRNEEARSEKHDECEDSPAVRLSVTNGGTENGKEALSNEGKKLKLYSINTRKRNTLSLTWRQFSDLEQFS